MSIFPIAGNAGIAVVDTSFWSLCCQAGLTGYLWQAWLTPIWVPTAVVRQIFHTPGPFPDQQQFRAAEQAGRLAVRDPQRLLPVFRTGEREVLALAAELGATALIDDFSPHEYAVTTLGLDAIGVAEFLVSLLSAGWIDIANAVQAYRRLDQLRATHQAWLRWAREELRQRGGQV